MRNKKGLSTLTHKQAQWLAHIHNADRAGVSLSAYAKQHDLSLKRLFNWRWQLRKQGHYIDPTAKPNSPSGFVEVTTRASIIGAPRSMRVVLPNGVRIECNGDSDELTHLLKLVSQL